MGSRIPAPLRREKSQQTISHQALLKTLTKRPFQKVPSQNRTTGTNKSTFQKRLRLPKQPGILPVRLHYTFDSAALSHRFVFMMFYLLRFTVSTAVLLGWLPPIAFGGNAPEIDTLSNGLRQEGGHDFLEKFDIRPPDGSRNRGLSKIDSSVNGKWQQFRHWSVGSQSLTCGTVCVQGVNSDFAPSAPWKFMLPQGGGCFIVVDAFDATDRFIVTDFDNTTLGTTSEPNAAVACGNDPEYCYGLAGVSKGSFYLGEGPHSIMLTVAQGKAGSAFFRVTTDTAQCQAKSSPSAAPSRQPSSTETPPPAGTQTSIPSGNRPPIALCKRSVKLPARTNCASRVNINGGSYDPDVEDRIKMVQSPRGPYRVGTTNVTLIVTDAAGDSDSCVTQVTVVDQEEISEESIDCGMSDWRVQSCGSPMTFSATYIVSTASLPNVKSNGCPVTITVDNDTNGAATCERCDSENLVENVDCQDIALASGSNLSLTQSTESGFFMTWKLRATDSSGRSILKTCGVCMENSGCRRANSVRNRQGKYLQRRATEAWQCPAQFPSSLDGSKTWPEQSIAELDNCAAIF